jgi:hypothetical protein
LSRWYPAIESHESAGKAAKMGVYGALGFAAWIGIPAALFISVRQLRSGIVSPVEVAIIALLVGFALLTAWRFHRQRGRIVGSILLVALVVEVSKRLVLTFGGSPSFGVFDAVVTFMMFFGVLNGVRGVRALRQLSPDGDLEEIFQ